MDYKCITSKGLLRYKFSGQHIYFLDQLSTDFDYSLIPDDSIPDDKWIWNLKFDEYIARKYDISGKDYINIVMTGDINNDSWIIPDDKYYYRLINSDYYDKYKNRGSLKCLISPGKILFKTEGMKGSELFMDQLDLSDDIWIRPPSFTKYICRKYALTLIEYYNLVVHGDINYIDLCPVCKVRSKTFYSLKNGYAKSCSDPECKRVTKSLNLELVWRDRNDEERSNILIPLHKSAIRLDTQCTASYNKFMNIGDEHDICYFYIALTDSNLFKFGITGDIERRVIISHMTFKYDFIHVLKEGFRSYIAELEYKVKMNLNSFNEYMDYNKNSISKFNDAYRKALNDLKNN